MGPDGSGVSSQHRPCGVAVPTSIITVCKCCVSIICQSSRYFEIGCPKCRFNACLPRPNCLARSLTAPACASPGARRLSWGHRRAHCMETGIITGISAPLSLHLRLRCVPQSRLLSHIASKTTRAYTPTPSPSPTVVAPQDFSL